MPWHKPAVTDKYKSEQKENDRETKKASTSQIHGFARLRLEAVARVLWESQVRVEQRSCQLSSGLF